MVVAAALAGSSLGAQAQTVTVVEYYNKTIDAYFLTGRANEQTGLDGVADFQRTGMTFQAVAAATAPPALTQICRFYIGLTTPYVSSHFYGRRGVDCESLIAARPTGFVFEDYDFATQQPASGVCTTGTTAIYRSFRAASGGKTSNHRYSASQATYTASVAAGYVGEEGVVFCATSATAATTAVAPPSSGAGDCGSFYFVGRRVTYQVTNSLSPTATTMVRTYDTTPVIFNGQAAVAVVDTPPTGAPSYSYLAEGATSWSSFGSRSPTGSATGGNQDVYFVPPIVYPKVMTIGQSITLNQSVQLNPVGFIGNGTLTGTVTLVGRESLTVPAGTYSTCKFQIDQVTSYASIGVAVPTKSVAWVVAGVGLIRSETTDSLAGTVQTLLATLVQ